MLCPRGSSVAGVPVKGDLRSIGPVDAVVVTDVSEPQAVYDAVVAEFAPDRVLAPGLLNVTRVGANGGEGAGQ